MPSLVVVPPCEPSLFWRVATWLVLVVCLLIIVAAAVALAMAFLRGARDDDDDDPDDGERVAPADPAAHVETDPRVLAARTRLDAAARRGGDVARLRGVSAPIARVELFPRATKGFRR